MRKLFLIPLMALFTCVMAFATVRTAGTFAELQSALADADCDEIQLTADINYGYSEAAGAFNITKSITIDGQGHTLTGGTARPDNSNQYAAIWVNYGGENRIDVTLKNLTIVCAKSSKYVYAVHTRGNIKSITCENVVMDITKGGKSNSPAFQLGGADANTANVTLTDCKILAKNNDYPLVLWVPANITATNSYFSGYCSVYFKDGSKGSTLNADACQFDAPNVHSGQSNAFAVFPMEDTPLTFVLNNCGVNSESLGDQSQNMFCFSEWGLDANRTGQVNITISGDNTYINCKDKWISNSYWWTNPSGDPNYGAGYAPTITTAEAAVHINVNAQITGGTYSVDPHEMIYWNDQYEDGEGYHYNLGHITIPEGYEVKAVTTQQGDQTTTLYRVRKEITTSNSINDNVEGEGYGQNENTEFLISANETVEQASTVANYVEVSNNATLTLPAGKTLEVTNGLDVTGGATLDVAAGSTLVVGEGGVTSESTESIVIEANENGSASFLLDPKVIVNTTPNLTVKMTVKGKGYKNELSGKNYYWHRFAAPVVMSEAWSKAPNYGTWLYGWDYNANGGQGAWAELSSSTDMVPFQGYTLSPEHLVDENEEIVYSFKGQLAGNQDMNLQFNARGFNFFGNSYTGYISVLTLVDQLMANANIDGTVYMWKNDGQGYEPVSLKDLEENPDHYLAWQKEIAPMQTFILRQINTGEGVSTLLNYENSIWNNPRYRDASASAPARKRVANEDPFVRVMITAANGQNSQMTFAENADRTDDFEKGYDALVYMNENTINVYSTMEGQDYANVATNNLEGKTLTLQTNNEIAYTMSFPMVEGEEYAIRDNVTGKVIAIEEGTTYDFAAQPNSTVEGRFEIVKAAKVTTAIENTEVKANVKGIYTITGQYLGENFDVLPAGVYVVDGVKIVK